MLLGMKVKRERIAIGGGRSIDWRAIEQNTVIGGQAVERAKVRIVQCLCPARHCIGGAFYPTEDGGADSAYAVQAA